MTKSENKGLKEKTYNILKERIIDCIYAPGSILNEAQLAQDLELSRTPIREAISKLEMDGYVKILPKKGIYVTDITFNDVMQVFQTRLLLEPISVLLAGPRLSKDELHNFINKFDEPVTDIQNSFRLDTAMHLFIIENCGNNYIIEMMRKVFDQNTRIIISSKQNQVQIHDAKNEHLELLNFLLSEKFDEASVQMRKHVETCKHAALDYFLNTQLYTAPISTSYKNELKKL